MRLGHRPPELVEKLPNVFGLDAERVRDEAQHVHAPGQCKGVATQELNALDKQVLVEWEAELQLAIAKS